MYQHLVDKLPTRSGWEDVHKVSIWDGRGNCETFTQAEVSTEADDCVQVKLHVNRLRDSDDLPEDVRGFELFASMDENATETHGQATIAGQQRQGNFRILTIPDAGPAIFTP